MATPRAAALTSVTILSPFWKKYQDFVAEHTIPQIIDIQKSLNHWTALTWERGHQPEPHAFWDSDVYKCLEAACCALHHHQNEHLAAEVERTVEMISGAQHSDGYINSLFTTRGLEHRWTNTRDLHELYCMGHLFEAAIAYKELTGMDTLLQVAYKAIAHVQAVFGRGNGRKPGYPGHQEIELALLRVYEFTNHLPALDLARYFLTERGRKDDKAENYWDTEAKARGGNPYDDQGTEFKAWYHKPRDYAYHQADCLLQDAAEIKGHSVRAMYYYTAATDLVRLEKITADNAQQISEIRSAVARVWRDMVDRKIYVTGAIGSVTQNEGFGEPYLLADLEAAGCYAETCAAFGLIVWCQRLLRLRLDAEVADVMELTLHNAFLGAMSADGNAFYYQNVLRTLSGKPKHRQTWFGCACCPPNVAKLISGLGAYIYSTSNDHQLIAIHLYISSQFTIPETGVVITQESDMPWEGNIVIRVSAPVEVALRIPGWTQDYTCSVSEGRLVDGYLRVSATPDSPIHLDFSVMPTKLYANPLTGKDEVCLKRGPLIYCFEDVDNVGLDIDRVAALHEAKVETGEVIEISTMEHVVTLKTKGRQLLASDSSKLYSTSPWVYEDDERCLTAIPYFLRANRGGNGGMRVWVKVQHGSHATT